MARCDSASRCTTPVTAWLSSTTSSSLAGRGIRHLARSRLAVLTRALRSTWPARPAEHGFGIGCGGHYHGALIGRGIGFTFILRVPPPFPAAAEVTGPPPGGCWVMTEVVVHYHVGIRHYAATDPYELAVWPKTVGADHCRHERRGRLRFMTTAQMLGMTDMSWPARWQRGRVRLHSAPGHHLGDCGARRDRRVLAWGPIGLGNGPRTQSRGPDAGPTQARARSRSPSRW